MDGLSTISAYLDFAISTTVHRQIPNIDENREKNCATEIITRFLHGDLKAFSRTYNIRENMRRITPGIFTNLMLYSLIVQEAYNKRVLHQIQPTEFIDQCAEFVTNVIANGRLNEIQEWISTNMNALTQNYVNEHYKESSENKKSRHDMAIENPTTQKALQQLNLEMRIEKIRHTK